MKVIYFYSEQQSYSTTENSSDSRNETLLFFLILPSSKGCCRGTVFKVWAAFSSACTRLSGFFPATSVSLPCEKVLERGSGAVFQLLARVTWLCCITQESGAWLKPSITSRWQFSWEMVHTGRTALQQTAQTSVWACMFGQLSQHVWFTFCCMMGSGLFVRCFLHVCICMSFFSFLVKLIKSSKIFPVPHLEAKF